MGAEGEMVRGYDWYGEEVGLGRRDEVCTDSSQLALMTGRVPSLLWSQLLESESDTSRFKWCKANGFCLG